ncbi:SpoIIAA family protein [Mycolicibacterium palauense]|uniref:STAS/SEC14 domain-containing protein n=1 Tax=Mycolicibacterium palauense TaxID=2034511 RepID=UPI000BFED503|nr:STAS/SEC14 domain-containing protein [Mycolicibacterium palauense]
MIEHELDTANSILTVRPVSALAQDDFAELAREIDPQIEQHGNLAGLILEVPSFPGWENLGSMITHLRFVRDHQKHVKKVAVVTDSALGDVAEHLASHFVSAEIRHFPAGDVVAARNWITTAA